MNAKKIRDIADRARADAAAKERWERSDEARRQCEQAAREAWGKDVQRHVEDCLQRAAEAAKKQECFIQARWLGNERDNEEFQEDLAKMLRDLGFITHFSAHHYNRPAMSEWDDGESFSYQVLEIFWREEDYNRLVREPARRRQIVRWVIFLLLVSVLAWLIGPHLIRYLKRLTY